ncbi:MAG: cation-translocating P-type ATPase [Candidatus Pacearchaeota archaeon]
MDWHAKKEAQVLEELKTSEKGLSEKEVKARLEKYGKNEIVTLKKFVILRIFLRQFSSFLVLILIFAALISAFIKNWLDFSVIISIVFLNSLFGFFQEYKAEKAIERLKEMLVPKSKVLREGKIVEIDSREIVPGDILVLSEGDKIMADARIISCENLLVNEAALTGESIPESKTSGILKVETALSDRKNMIYQGTEVVRGKCKAVVTETNMKTEFGKIAELVQKIEPEKNPLKERLDNFARVLGIIAIILIGAITFIGLSLGFDKFQVFLTAVSLAVSAIPEGLPAVITICLALATQRMLRINSLIRKLPAAETLGRATFICVDKTGTITEEKMRVTKIFVNNKILEKFTKNRETGFLFKIGILCNNARIEGNGIEEYLVGDPTEKALILSAKDFGLYKKEETEKQPKIKEFPFSSERKMMAVVRDTKRGYFISYVKGAPEVVIKKCDYEILNGKIKRINKIRKQELLSEYEEMASQGLRVLAFAYKKIYGLKRDLTQEIAENELVFVGFQGMIDAPRPEVKEAIKECENAGIKVVMITGDSALTAKAVGEEIGLKGKIIISKELEKMNDYELSKKIYETAIFARASPHDKLRIVNILKKNGEIVAVTGDGVNDALALKKADIGIAVNRGTDVAKEASDMVLLDNNFTSIVKAVKEGRRVYDNIKKFVKYMLSANTNEITLVLFALIIKWPLPLLPLQILWLNFITDSFPALAISTEEAESDIMKKKPRKESILKGNIGFILFAGFLAFFICLIVFYLYMQDLDKARTMALTTSVMFQMFLVFNAKTNKSVFKSRLNKWVIYGVLISTILHLILIYSPLNVFFGLVFLKLIDWLLIFGICFVCFLLLEFIKMKSSKI